LLSYFRINDPYRLLALLVMMILAWLPLIIDTPPLTEPELSGMVLGEKVSEGFALYHEIIDVTPPLASWFYGACDLLAGRNQTVHHIIGLFILFFQGVFLGVLLINKKTFPENTYVPTFIFSALTLVSFDMLILSAELAAFGFLLLALSALLSEIEFRANRDEAILNLGLFTGIASLFNFSYAIYLPGFILILIFFTRNTIRKYLLMVIGFLLPHMLLISGFFISDQAAALWQRFYLPAFHFPSNTYMSASSMLVLGSIPIVYWLVSIVMLNRKAHLTKYQSQVMQAMWLWFFIALIQLYFTPEFHAQSILPILPPLSFFFTHFFLLIRRRKFANMNAWILLLGMGVMLYAARYNLVDAVDYTRLTVPASTSAFSNKRILNLSADQHVYANNMAAPPFLNNALTQEIFAEPNYYENIVLINRLMEKDPPDVILDPDNRMENIFKRLPALQSRYRRSADGHWLRISN
jgi:hypothetical protein